MESNNQFDFNNVVESLKMYLRKGTEAGLQAVNDKTNGKFESKFETAFVDAIQGLKQKETKEFRKEVGSIDAKKLKTAEESEKGSDVRVTWHYPTETSKVFTLYLQLKMFYGSYVHYYNATTIGMSPLDKPPKEEKWKTATSGFFNAQYKSTLAGTYEDEYQLIRMQTVLRDMDFEKGGGFRRQAGAFLIIEAPGMVSSPSRSKNAWLVPLQAFQAAVYGHVNEPLQVSDVTNFNAQQLYDTISGKISLVDDSKFNDGTLKFDAWAKNFIKAENFVTEAVDKIHSPGLSDQK